MLSSEVLTPASPRLDAIRSGLPPGYTLEISGEYEEQVKGFKNLATVMAISVVAIFLALVLQVRHAIKPLIVFASIPFGMVGARLALWITGSPRNPMNPKCLSVRRFQIGAARSLT